MNEWWMIGKYALNNNCADEIVNIFCDENLTKQNNTVTKSTHKPVSSTSSSFNNVSQTPEIHIKKTEKIVVKEN